MHEVAHVLLGHLDDSSTVIPENLDGVGGDKEAKADSLAQSLVIPAPLGALPAPIGRLQNEMETALSGSSAGASLHGEVAGSHPRAVVSAGFSSRRGGGRRGGRGRLGR